MSDNRTCNVCTSRRICDVRKPILTGEMDEQFKVISRTAERYSNLRIRINAALADNCQFYTEEK